MELVEAVVLGLVQGITEFLPISSSAHLVLLPWLLGWQDPGLTFDVGLHLGTFLAVLVFFWRDWWRIGRDFVNGIGRLSFFEGQTRLGWLLLLGTIPGVIAGVLLEHEAETVFRDIRLVAVMLMLLGLVLLLAERMAQHVRGMDSVSLADSLLIGIAQAFAIIPGVSRSGSTISMGLFRGLQRESAARFSFMLGTPIILGASAKRLPSIFTGALLPDDRLPFILGAMSSAVAGFATIALLLRFLQRHSTMPFVVYRLLLGLAILGLYVWRGP